MFGARFAPMTLGRIMSIEGFATVTFAGKLAPTRLGRSTFTGGCATVIFAGRFAPIRLGNIRVTGGDATVTLRVNGPVPNEPGSTNATDGLLTTNNFGRNFGSNGSLPAVASASSNQPSPSVSRLVGSVCSACS